MAKTKLTKSAVDAAQPQALAIELRDTLVPDFLCKVTKPSSTAASSRCWVSPRQTHLPPAT